MQRAIQGDIVEVEADDPVEGGKCLGLELLEHAGPAIDSITSSAQGGVGHLAGAGAADRRPQHHIDDFGLECTHDDGEVLPQVVGVGVHPA